MYYTVKENVKTLLFQFPASSSQFRYKERSRIYDLVNPRSHPTNTTLTFQYHRTHWMDERQELKDLLVAKKLRRIKGIIGKSSHGKQFEKKLRGKSSLGKYVYSKVISGENWKEAWRGRCRIREGKFVAWKTTFEIKELRGILESACRGIVEWKTWPRAFAKTPSSVEPTN